MAFDDSLTAVRLSIGTNKEGHSSGRKQYRPFNSSIENNVRKV